MVYSRVIPCLLIKDGELVKTTKFKDPRYIGDPINAIKIFNVKEVDELLVIDIAATDSNREPDYALIKTLASECFMPLCYGGGVKSIDQMRVIYNLGVEKISLSSSSFDYDFLREAVKTFGAQSVVVTIDVKKNIFGKYSVYTHNGSKLKDTPLDSLIDMFNNIGIGELVINSINNDGVMKGYDHTLIRKVVNLTKVPVIALGGAGSLADIISLFKEVDIFAAAAGSLFVYHGRLKGVLINYPGFDCIQEKIGDGKNE